MNIQIIKYTNNLSNKIIFIIVIIFCHISILFSQDKETLQQRREQKINEIQYTSKLINTTKKNKRIAINQLLILNRRLEIRENLINEINNEISYIDNKINKIEKKIGNSKEEIQNIKQEYEKIIYNTYKHYNTYNRLMFILSAENFNQAYKRIIYIKQYSEYRKKQVQKIKEIQAQLEQQISELNEKKEQKIQLIQDKREEKQKFANESQQREEMIEQLKQREKELKEELNKKRAIAEKLEKEIQKIIEKEAKQTEEGYYKLTPAEKIVSKSFEKNKGGLPWPTKQGIITEIFGMHKHQVLKGVTVNNNGIDISTVGGSEVRAIFSGTVSKIIAIKGANNTIILRHGNFLTVYQNLNNVTVEVGQKVNVKQTLGYIYKEKNGDESILHFEIWKETQKLNPEDWLIKK